MITLIVGHRGVGKSALLKRIKSYLRDSETLDLDSAIAESEGMSVSDILEKRGEDHFRKIETLHLLKNLNSFQSTAVRLSRIFIAVGAGCDLTFLKELRVKPEVLWLRRKTDPLGRIFLNRPLLNKNFSPFEDYLARFASREKMYSAVFDECLILPEGLDYENEFEKSYFQNTLDAQGGSLSLLPRHFKSTETLERFLEKRRAWNLNCLEFREDLLTPGDLENLLIRASGFKILYSFRRPASSFSANFANMDRIRILGQEGKIDIDWPLEWGASPFPVKFLSFHGDFEHGLNLVRDSSFLALGEFIKFAPMVSSFKELYEGHLWVLENPRKNIFLPCGGPWHWYRQFLKGKFELNFIREDDGTSLEQPTLMQWLMTPTNLKNFSAVLGHPVVHSRSPVEHQELGAFFDIDIPVEEFAGAISVLEKLGLKNAAVTAPFKESAGGVNTLKIRQGQISTLNTDQPALSKELEKWDRFDESTVAVWGGGGTLGSIKASLPRASFYSARTASPRQNSSPVSKPECVVWAAARSSAFKNPPVTWKPKMVFDLNYAESSPGLEFALQTGAEYFSGLEMFKRQAKLQKEFWSLP